jgi:hypothetical protein
MRRLIIAAFAGVAGVVFAAPAAWAGSPHFVTVSAAQSSTTLTVSGKEAGLGNEQQVHIVVTATALCINGGGKHPKAVNKTSVSTAGDFPVQNGKADFSLSVTATFQPDCSPPMTVSFADVVVADTTNGISERLTGAF